MDNDGKEAKGAGKAPKSVQQTIKGVLSGSKVVSKWGPDKNVQPTDYPSTDLHFTPKSKKDGVYEFTTYVHVTPGEGKSPWALCLECKKEGEPISVATFQHSEGTSNAWKHLAAKHGIKKDRGTSEDPDERALKECFCDVRRKCDFVLPYVPLLCREELSQDLHATGWVIEDLRPFEIVKDKALQRWVDSICVFMHCRCAGNWQRQYKLPSPDTVLERMGSAYEAVSVLVTHSFTRNSRCTAGEEEFARCGIRRLHDRSLDRFKQPSLRWADPALDRPQDVAPAFAVPGHRPHHGPS
jgi:hypothetical protein